MKIGIDIDDTISDTYEIIFNYAQRYNVEEINKTPIIDNRDCYHHHYTAVLHHWTKDEENDFWNKYFFKMLKEVRPKTFAKDYINKLAEENEIYLITARLNDENNQAEKITKEWLEEFGIKYDKLILDATEKDKVAQENAIDVFIDDSFENCKAVSKVCKKTYLMDSRTNRDLDEKNENFERVYSWPHLYQEINKKR